jgi:hypothetical protein
MAFGIICRYIQQKLRPDRLAIHHCKTGNFSQFSYPVFPIDYFVALGVRHCEFDQDFFALIVFVLEIVLVQ